MPETTPLIKAALNLRVGAGFDVYRWSWMIEVHLELKRGKYGKKKSRPSQRLDDRINIKPS